MRRFRSTAPLLALCLILLACSGADQEHIASIPSDLEPLEGEMMLAFSRDARRSAVAVRDKTGKHRVVIDGVTGKAYDWVSDLRAVNHPAGFIYRAGTGDHQVVVMGRAEGPVYDRVSWLTATKDGIPVYVATDRGQSFLVRGTEEGKRYDSIDEFVQAGGTFAMIARQGKMTFAVLNGMEGPPHPFKRDTFDRTTVLEGIGALTVSKDGKHHAYVVWNTNGEYVMADGSAQRRFDSISSELTFGGKDGATLAYLARRDEAERLVVNGIEGRQHAHIQAFAIDAAGMAYLALQEEGHSEILRNEERVQLLRGIRTSKLLTGPDGGVYAQLHDSQAPVGLMLVSVLPTDVVPTPPPLTLIEHAAASGPMRSEGLADIETRDGRTVVRVNGHLGPVVDAVGSVTPLGENKGVVYGARDGHSLVRVSHDVSL